MLVLFIVTAIDLIGFGMIFPLFPLFKLKFEVLDNQIGYVASVFAVGIIIGNILFGMLSDKFGRKPLLAIPMLLLAIVYYITGFVESYEGFLVLRFLSGFLSGNFSVAFAAAADLSSPANRLKYMGLIAAAFGAGFIFGPALGGYLAGNSTEVADINFHTPFVVSAALCIIAALIVIFFLKESLSKKDRETVSDKNIWQQVKEVYTKKVVWFYSFLNISLISLMGAIQVFLAIWLNRHFHFTPQEIGLFWGGYAVIATLTQVGLVHKIKPKVAILGGFFVLGLSLLALPVMIYGELSIIMFYIITILMAIATAVITPNISAGLSLQGEKNQQGMIFGIGNSIANVGRIIGPIGFGYLFHISDNIMWIVAALFCFVLVWVGNISVKISNKVNN
jgi:DHA1 family tetracycline resistance protein-like MFS transporter